MLCSNQIARSLSVRNVRNACALCVYIYTLRIVCVLLVLWCVLVPKSPKYTTNILFSVKNGVWNKSKTENFIRRFALLSFSIAYFAGCVFSFFVNLLLLLFLVAANEFYKNTNTLTHAHMQSLWTHTHTYKRARMHTHIRTHRRINIFIYPLMLK